MFYISSTAKLRKSTSLTQNERVFALRELWQYAMSGSMLHSIYVFNPKLDYVYTTDNDYMSASMDGFYDQDAVALYRQRSPENRMRLYHRTFRENGEDYGSEWYSYLVYEVTASGKTGESAVGPFSAVTRTSVSASAAPVISMAAAQTAAQIFFIMKIILSLFGIPLYLYDFDL